MGPGPLARLWAYRMERAISGIGRRPIFADGRRHVFPLEELVHLELDQDLVPEVRAGHPVGGEGLLGTMPQRRQFSVGQRGTPVGQPPASLLLLALAAAQRAQPRRASTRHRGAFLW